MNYKICTFNVNGLGEYKKRCQIFEWLKNNKYDICFLQELHCQDIFKDKWTQEWGSQAFFCGNSSNSTGIGILFSPNVNFKVLEYIEVITGRIQVLKINLNDMEVVLINVYGPNKDDKHFFLELEKVIKQFEHETLIIGGDFNTIIDNIKDKKNGRVDTNKINRQHINSLIVNYDLNDIWRIFNNDNNHFTWHSNHKPPIFCRLDYFLTSSNIINKTSKCKITSGIRSDHSIVYFTFNPISEPRGPGYFKLNNSILLNNEYQNIIRDSIKSIADINKDANDNTKWEIIKGAVRNESIKFASKLKKDMDKNETNLKKEVDKLEQELSNDTDNNEILESLDEKKNF